MSDKEKEKRTEEEEEEESTALMSEDDDDNNGETKPLLEKVKPLLAPLAIAVVVGYLMITFAGVPRSDFNAAVSAVEWEVGEMGGKVTGVKDLVDVLNDRLASVEVKAGNNANLLIGTVSRSEFDTLVDEADDLNKEIDDLYAIVSGLESTSEDELINLIEVNFAEYEVIITDYEARIAEMEALLEELELIDKDGEAVTTDDITLWTKELYSTSNVAISYTISPSRLEEEGDYIMMVYLVNYDTDVKNDVVVDIILSPKTGDRVKVDEAEIYLDSTRTPFYAWFGEVVKRSDGTCRRMVFTSEKMRIDAAEEHPETAELVALGYLTLRLEFTLAYK